MTRGVVHILYRVIFLLVILFTCVSDIVGAQVNRGNKIFLASSINNSLPYIGQEILLTYTLFFKDAAPKISNETAPMLRGIWAKETVPERYIQSKETLIQGEPFRYAVVKQFRLVPLQSGKITVSGYSIVCNLPHEQGNGGQETTDTRIRITAPDVVVSPLALPEPVPEGFSGAVGTFQLELSADKLNVKAGEPLSLKILLTGTGSLLTLKLPDLHLPESFRQNPPEITTALQANSLPTKGSITTIITAWPQSKGVYQIPALRTVAFNPETREFTTLFSKPLSITVTQTPQTKTITSRILPLSAVTKQNANLSLLLLVTTIALLFLMTRAVTILAKRKKMSTGNVQTDSDTSPANLKQLLFISLEKTGIKSPGGLTRMELKNAMQETGLPDDVQSALPAVLDSLDRILYSPTEIKENRTPDSITTKVNTLLQALRPKTGS